jgi:hypothetical protein
MAVLSEQEAPDEVPYMHTTMQFHFGISEDLDQDDVNEDILKLLHISG